VGHRRDFPHVLQDHRQPFADQREFFFLFFDRFLAGDGRIAFEEAALLAMRPV
jgi:hypothetical protein